MLKGLITFVVLAGFAGFIYFYSTNSSEPDRVERAKLAARDLGDAVRDKGLAEAVSAHLVARFGLQPTRFLHTHYDQGRVLVYGLAPEQLDPEQIRTEAAKVPGVKEVEVLIQPLPDYLRPAEPAGDQPAPLPADQP